MKIFVTRTVEVDGVASFQEAISKFNDGKAVLTTATLHPPTTTPRGGKIPVAQPIQPIPRKEWPMWAKALAMIAKPEDKGIGDVIARTIGSENSEAFKKWYKATTGTDCGCTGRQRRWNIEYPLNLKAS